MKTSEEVIETFLRFFQERNHHRIDGSSLIPEGDPTLLFVNSGMAPLKPYFLGQKKPPHPDLCNVQPCIRTVDIDAVGDRHHLTLFEMMGSWSIGDYWKDRAVELAYDLLVNHFRYDPGRLYATVYSGSSELNIPPDEESAAAWARVGLPPSHIVPLGEDNFWGPAGKYGPCGPCTEVFFDTGPEHGPEYHPGGHFDTDSRYIEIWNAGVFMEFDKQPNGLTRLSLRSVDTGSGLERMLMNLNQLDSVYETDRLKPIVSSVQQQLGGAADPALVRDAKVIADHVRATSLIVADGVTPSNTGRGYIPRRLIRKCVALVTRRGISSFRIDEVIATVVASMGRQYPQLVAERARIIDTYENERRAFSVGLSHGFEKLAALASQRPFSVSGRDALQLFATYGLPLEIIRDYVRDHGGDIDEVGFEQEFKHHQEVSRGAAEGAAAFEGLEEVATPTRYLGEDALAAAGVLQAIYVDGQRRDSAGEGEDVDLVFDSTSFYAESGGQVGDRGEIVAPTGRASIADTVKVRDAFHLHRGRVMSGTLVPGATVELRVDPEHRRRVRANHSATHLLQSALRVVLGSHVKQAGSRVDPLRLRFDFQHGEKLSLEQRQRVELLVNDYVARNVVGQVQVGTYQEAMQRGALAFFGESYGDTVRTVAFGDFSTELCGGSHVRATGDIGTFRIVSESSVGSGIRRIVAVTGEEAVRYSQRSEAILEGIAARLKVPVDGVETQLARLLDRASPRQSAAAPARHSPAELRADLRTLPGGTSYLWSRRDEAGPALRTAALEAAESLAAIICLTSVHDDRAAIVIAVPKSLTGRFRANEILDQMLPLVDGQGGGKAHLAQGGGRSIADLDSLRLAFESALARAEAG
jgi:alanyl-tRNA synthetase